MSVTSSEIDKLLKQLTETPGRIASLSQGVEGERLHFRGDAAWSANDILAHLRACHDVWGKAILAMISKDHPTLRYVSPRTWIRKTDYPELEFGVSLEAFAGQRNELLKSLKALELVDWSRGATFTGTTRGREQTVLSYARRIAEHESEHCEQASALLKQT